MFQSEPKMVGLQGTQLTGIPLEVHADGPVSTDVQNAELFRAMGVGGRDVKEVAA